VRAFQCEIFTIAKGPVEKRGTVFIAATIHKLRKWKSLRDFEAKKLPGVYEIAYINSRTLDFQSVYFGQSVNLKQRLSEYRRGTFDRTKKNLKQKEFDHLLKTKQELLYVRVAYLDNLIVDREPIPEIAAKFPKEKDVLNFIEHGVLKVVNFSLNSVKNQGYRERGPFVTAKKKV